METAMFFIFVVGVCGIVILFIISTSVKRDSKSIMKIQEALIQEGNYKAAAMTTEDMQILVGKQSNIKLLLMGVFAVLTLSTYFGFEYFNFADYALQGVKYLKWW